MPANTKAVKQRIKSAKNTKKITKAMELVSAAKMRKAVEAATSTRTYAQYMRDLLVNLSHVDEPHVPLFAVRPVEKVLVILVSSNRGLCGSFNSKLFKSVHDVIADKKALAKVTDMDGELIEGKNDIAIDIIGLGKKSAMFARQADIELKAVYDEITENPTYDQVYPIGRMMIEGFLDRSYDKILVAYNQFESALVQHPTIQQILPLSPEMLKSGEGKEQMDDIHNYIFEPGLEAIVEDVLPKLLEAQLYQAVLESVASEHSARMLAMKNATDNAGELIEELTLEFNKARQAAITQEIAEIASGAQALS